LRDAGDIRVLITDGKDNQVHPLSYFLPHRFGPDDLLSKDFPLLLEPRSNGLIAAFTAANASYAPYSRCPSGLSIATKKGEVYSGSYMESAAYNPGLPALQAAIVAFICGGGGDYDEIETVVLVETRDAVVRHAATVRLGLQSLAPQASFHVSEADFQQRKQ
jgi:cytidine deaminase